MGLLDDAIREHLDLKRRRGADPTEVEREEREVLGPVRRRGEPTFEDEQAHLDHEPLPDETGWDDPAGETGPPPPTAAFDHEQFAALEPEDEPYAPTARDPEPYAPPVHESDPFPAAEPYRPDVGHEPPLDQSTAEFRVEDALAEEDRSHRPHAEDAFAEEDRPRPPHVEDEDVLEETPDFLQDTPDHDRLWFEQRPPRDFDFDG